MIRYADTPEDVSPDRLRGGFFEHWPNPPSPETHLQPLKGSDEVVLALDRSDVVCFTSAVADGVLCAYVPLLEVLPGHRGRGIGHELARRMLAKLDDLYLVDVLCDPDVQPFYAALGMEPATGMMLRHYENQAGKNPSGAIY